MTVYLRITILLDLATNQRIVNSKMKCFNFSVGSPTLYPVTYGNCIQLHQFLVPSFTSNVMANFKSC